MLTDRRKNVLLGTLCGLLVLVVGAESAFAVAGHWRRVARRTTAVVATTSTAAAAGASAAASQQASAQSSQASTSSAQAQQPAQTQQPAPTQQPAQTQAAPAQPAGAPPVGSTVTTLPAGCEPVTSDGVQYQNCGGVFYRSAFQGNNLVYVVVDKP